MRLFWALVVCVVALVAAPRATDAAAAAPLPRQATAWPAAWEGLLLPVMYGNAEFQGITFSVEARFKVDLSADLIVLGRVLSGSFVYDPATSHFDITWTNGQGILEDDSTANGLITRSSFGTSISVSLEAGKRPSSFVAQTGVFIMGLFPPPPNGTCTPLAKGVLPSFSSLPQKQWRVIKPGGVTSCGNPFPGPETDYAFYIRPGRGAAAANIVISFDGSGACWNREQCAAAGLTSVPAAEQEAVDCSTRDAPGAFGRHATGTLAAEVEDYTLVHIPHCTADMHVGDVFRDYGEDEDGVSTTMRHHGYRNVRSVLKYVFDSLQSPSNVMVEGCGSGAFAAKVYAPYIAQHYPAATVTAFADSLISVMTDTMARQGLGNWAAQCTVQGYPAFMGNNADGEAYDVFSTSHLTDAGFAKILYKAYETTGNLALVEYTTNADREQIAEFNAMKPANAGSVADEWWRRAAASIAAADAALPDRYTSYTATGASHCAGSVTALSSMLYDIGTRGGAVGGSSGGFTSGTGATSVTSVDCAGCAAADTVGCDMVAGSGAVYDDCGVCSTPSAESGTSCMLPAIVVTKAAECTVDTGFFPPAQYTASQADATTINAATASLADIIENPVFSEGTRGAATGAALVATVAVAMAAIWAATTESY